MQATAKCGCEVEMWIWDTGWGGCCCGECYDSYGTEYHVEEVKVTKACATHGG